METIANPNWETEDDWENFNQYPVFSQDVTYHAGDKCTGRFRIWTATATTKGVVPYKQMGQVDSQERLEEWIRGRIYPQTAHSTAQLLTHNTIRLET